MFHFKVGSILLLCMVFSVQAEQIPAFPGAEGFGSHTPGGRGGKIVYVTNLNDTGEGSLRQALRSGNSIVIFRVGGTIELESPLKFYGSHITIAGQSAPGGGICIKNYPMIISSTNDIVVRYLRFRHGDESGYEGDALWITTSKNVIIDHCSASWSVDETLSVTRADSVTVQWCFITESLDNSVHSKGAHGYGGLVAYIDDGKISQHHNLWAHHRSRNPRPGSTQNMDMPGLHYDFRNNLIYNWGSKAGYTNSNYAKIKMNYVGNYLLAGPSTHSSVRDEAFDPDSRKVQIHVDDNLINDKDLGWGIIKGVSYTKVFEPFETPPMTTDSPDSVFYKVLADAGASLPMRDSVDIRIVNTVLEAKGAILDSQSEVGGWPLLASGEPYPDADMDGMSDDWEAIHGLDPESGHDQNLDNDGDGYTNVEEFLNSTDPNAIETGIKTRTLATREPDISLLEQNYPNPFDSFTSLRFKIRKTAQVSVGVYNVFGQHVATLCNDVYQAGVHRVTWDGQNSSGKKVANGLYYAILKAGNERNVIKMTLLKN